MQLVINAGSSSLKWALFSNRDTDECVLEGLFDGLGRQCRVLIGSRTETRSIADHTAAVKFIFKLLDNNNIAKKQSIMSVVHRVVHGGEKYSHPAIVDASVIRDIKEYSRLAPLHNPANLAGIHAAQSVLTGAVHIAVFDTAFHHTIAKEIYLYGLPQQLYHEHGIRKYGFHGTSHSYIASKILEEYGQHTDAISCHLGSGSSITALKRGRSADTTMGFTPLDGLIMGTRSGEIDPEIPLFLIRLGYSVEQVEDMLSHKSGLLGVTGESDLRKIWERAQKEDPMAELAIDMLAFRVAYYVNAMRTTVPNFSVLAFTGGIGENAWYIRKKACKLLQIPISDHANQESAETLSTNSSDIQVKVIHTDEQLQMHRLARTVLP